MAKDYLPQKIGRLQKLYTEDKPVSNLNLMMSYIRSRKNEGLSSDTIINDVKALTEFSKVISKPVELLDRDDVYAFFDYINRGAKTSANLYKIKIRIFFEFINRNDLADLCKIKKTKTDNRLPEDLLTQEDIEKLIDASLNLRDKAFVAVLYESGARRGELMDLQLKHITFDENGAIVTLPKGKTGARRVRLVYASGLLRNWLDNHPLKQSRDAYVWASFRDPNKTIEYRSSWESLQRTAERAGIKKRVNPHSFRHARATYLAKDLTEQQLKQYLGWTAGSSMASIYVHLSGKDIDNAILKLNGIVTEEAKSENVLKVIKCPRCKEVQDLKALYCFKCGLPLSDEAIDEGKETEKDINAFVSSQADLTRFLIENLQKGNPDLIKAIRDSLKNEMP